jgi:hypothetical protein
MLPVATRAARSRVFSRLRVTEHRPANFFRINTCEKPGNVDSEEVTEYLSRSESTLTKKWGGGGPPGHTPTSARPMGISRPEQTHAPTDRNF